MHAGLDDDVRRRVDNYKMPRVQEPRCKSEFQEPSVGNTEKAMKLERWDGGRQ